MESRSSASLEDEPRATWVRLERALEVVAQDYHKKHGRAMTLVLDGADLLAKSNVALFKDLQGFAKECADRRGVRLERGRFSPSLLPRRAR